MIPPQPGPTTSRAEGRMFQRFRSELSQEWTVLHSVGLAAHTSKRWAEADFVLVGPRGVYCLEVKGGRVTREGGVWRFTDASGNVNEKRESPFEQAGGEEAALRRHLQNRQVERIGSGRIAIGWGVAFPDIRFNVIGPDIDLDVAYDALDEAGKMSAYVERLADHWYARLQKLWGRPPVDLHPAHVARVVSVLRPDFDLHPSLRYVAAAAGRRARHHSRQRRDRQDDACDRGVPTTGSPRPSGAVRLLQRPPRVMDPFDVGIQRWRGRVPLSWPGPAADPKGRAAPHAA